MRLTLGHCLGSVETVIPSHLHQRLVMDASIHFQPSDDNTRVRLQLFFRSRQNFGHGLQLSLISPSYGQTPHCYSRGKNVTGYYPPMSRERSERQRCVAPVVEEYVL